MKTIARGGRAIHLLVLAVASSLLAMTAVAGMLSVANRQYSQHPRLVGTLVRLERPIQSWRNPSMLSRHCFHTGVRATSSGLRASGYRQPVLSALLLSAQTDFESERRSVRYSSGTKKSKKRKDGGGKTGTSTAIPTEPDSSAGRDTSNGDSMLEGSLSLSDLEPSNERLIKGLVVERYGDRLLVEYINPEEEPGSPAGNATRLMVCSQKAMMVDVGTVVGDIVQVKVQINATSAGDDSGTNAGEPILSPLNPDSNGLIFGEGLVIGYEKRRNFLQRPAPGTSLNRIKMKPIASNIDQLVIVVAGKPQVPLQTIDQYIVAAIATDIPDVIIVLNKFDTPESQEFESSLDPYISLGYEVVKTSSKASSSGLSQLESKLRDKTSIFVGNSAVAANILYVHA
jgi:ribosome small subunit-dependent GTPase A